VSVETYRGAWCHLADYHAALQQGALEFQRSRGQRAAQQQREQQSIENA
jgi:hypothetical protein